MKQLQLSEKTKSMGRKALLALIIVLVYLGFTFWQRYEQAKGRDIQKMSLIGQIADALSRYNYERSAYPVVGEPLVIGGVRAMCLSREGFAAKEDQSCLGKSYIRLAAAPNDVLAATYVPMAEDGTQCAASAGGCPAYEVTFTLETNAISKKGDRRLTPKGIQ